jgi:flagellar L-ring protein precursor FlgH
MKALLLVALLAGCAPVAHNWSNNADYEPELVEAPELVDSNGGFVYTGASPYAPRRARAVGDLVTIRIVHETQADSRADTKLTRGSTLGGGVTALFGLETAIGKLGEGGPTLAAEATTQNDFTGNGSTNRKGSLSGTLTARVMEVLPGGQLVLAGRQAVMVNDEMEYLGLRGVVDPRSIDTDNIVLSNAMADVRIEYTGQGVVAGKQRPGWFTRILDLVSPL